MLREFCELNSEVFALLSGLFLGSLITIISINVYHLLYIESIQVEVKEKEEEISENNVSSLELEPDSSVQNDDVVSNHFEPDSSVQNDDVVSNLTEQKTPENQTIPQPVVPPTKNKGNKVKRDKKRETLKIE